MSINIIINLFSKFDQVLILCEKTT